MPFYLFGQNLLSIIKLRKNIKEDGFDGWYLPSRKELELRWGYNTKAAKIKALRKFKL